MVLYFRHACADHTDLATSGSNCSKCFIYSFVHYSYTWCHISKDI